MNAFTINDRPARSPRRPAVRAGVERSHNGYTVPGVARVEAWPHRPLAHARQLARRIVADADGYLRECAAHRVAGVVDLREHEHAAPFRVGPRRYAVHVSPGPIVFDGAECFGLIEVDALTISIAGEVPPPRRLAVLLHELCHAAVFAFGRPAGEEELCDLFASIGETAIADLAAAGGVEALERLAPGEWLGEPRPAARSVPPVPASVTFPRAAAASRR